MEKDYKTAILLQLKDGRVPLAEQVEYLASKYNEAMNRVYDLMEVSFPSPYEGGTWIAERPSRL